MIDGDVKDLKGVYDVEGSRLLFVCRFYFSDILTCLFHLPTVLLRTQFACGS